MNTHGINFDVGLPLETKQEFDILYVDYLQEEKIRFSEWLKDDNSSSFIISGQIGTGKSTFINQYEIKADINLQLDKLFPKTKGSFYGLFLGKLLELSIQNKIDLTVYNFETLYNQSINDINSLVELLVSDTVNLSLLKEQSKLYDKIEKDIELIKKQLSDIICKNTKILTRKLFIFAEGVDKYNPGQTADLYDNLVDFLDFIVTQKTLYEANFIHISDKYLWIQNSEKLIIPNAADDIIKKVLEKRLGIYSETLQINLSDIVKLSGGNFRQAIKLLIEYEFARRKLLKNNIDALNYAIKRVKNDYFSYINLPFEFLKTINRDKYIHIGTIKADEKLSDYPVYRNLILITGNMEKGKFSAIINPLFQNETDEYKPEIKNNQSDEILKFNLTEMLDKLATYFLEQNKQEIVIILYDNIEIAQIIDDYLVGKAGSFEEIYYQSVYLEKDKAVISLLEPYPKLPFTGQSYFFKEKLDKKTLSNIDKLRDRLIIKNMIWWIKTEHIKDFIKNLTQLRQFIKIFDLKKDILNYLSSSEIQEDIEDLELLDYQNNDSLQIKQRLTKILNYIKSE